MIEYLQFFVCVILLCNVIPKIFCPQQILLRRFQWVSGKSESKTFENKNKRKEGETARGNETESVQTECT
jgi:hypothetical protein